MTWTRDLLGLKLERRGLEGRRLHDRASSFQHRDTVKAARPIVLFPCDRQRRLHVLAALRRLAAYASEQEPVFYEDEMDVHLNPKIGATGCRRGTVVHRRRPQRRER